MPNSPPPSWRTGTEHLRLLLEHGDVGAWELDVATGQAWRNLRHDQIFGYDTLLDEWTYERFLDHVVLQDREGVDARYGAALREETPWDFECRIDRADGERRWITATGKPIRGDDGAVTNLIGHVIDVTHVKRGEEHLRTITSELNHRVKNTLTVVQVIANRSFPDDRPVAEGRRDFLARIQALAETHGLLTDESWTGARVGDVVRRSLAPYCDEASGQCALAGPEVWLEARTAVSLSMAINELATNAVKYGALSRESGRVRVAWSRSDAGHCTLTWQESGGPPVREPDQTGFGMLLIRRLLPSETAGEASVTFAEDGLRADFAFALGKA